MRTRQNSVDISIFWFSLLGGREGGVRGTRKGHEFLKIPEGGGFSQWGAFRGGGTFLFGGGIPTKTIRSAQVRHFCLRRYKTQLRPEGRNRRGETRLRGPEVLGPLPRNSTPRFSNSGSRKPLPRGPLEPRKGSQGLGEGSSGASERGVRFQRSGKTR